MTESVTSVAYGPDGAVAVSAGADAKAIVWDTTDWRPLHELLGHNSAITSAAFSPDGQTVATKQRRCNHDSVGREKRQPAATAGWTRGRSRGRRPRLARMVLCSLP